MKILKYTLGIVLLVLLLVLGSTYLHSVGALMEALTAYFWGAYIALWKTW